MDYFFHPHVISERDAVFLSAEESRHAAAATRARIGDKAYLLNGKGLRAEAVFTKVDAKQCALTIIDVLQEAVPAHAVHIAMANLKKRDRLEWFVEKAVELGASQISIFSSHRTEKKAPDKERLLRIAVSALKQSGNLWLPEIETRISFQDVLNSIAHKIYIAHCSDAIPAELLTKVYTPATSATILIGPEGDFTEEEIKLAIKAGAVSVSLGANRLRAETAALAALVIARMC